MSYNDHIFCLICCKYLPGVNEQIQMLGQDLEEFWTNNLMWLLNIQDVSQSIRIIHLVVWWKYAWQQCAPNRACLILLQPPSAHIHIRFWKIYIHILYINMTRYSRNKLITHGSIFLATACIINNAASVRSQLTSWPCIDKKNSLKQWLEPIINTTSFVSSQTFCRKS